MQIPELVNLDEVGVIAGEHEVGIVFEEEIGDVVEVREPGERGRVEAVADAKFVAEQAGGFGQVVDEMRALGVESVT